MGRRAAAVALALAVAATSCTGDGEGDDRVLYVATGQDVSGNDLYLKLVQEWNALQGPDGYRAYLVELPGSADEQYAEMVRDAQSGRPEYDIVNIDNQFTSVFAEAGWIEEIGPAWAEANADAGAEGGDALTTAFREESVQSVTYRGQVRAIPFTADVGMLYYRSDLVGQGALTAGRSLSGILTEIAENTGAEHLYIGQFAEYEGFTVNTMEIVAGEGGTLVRPPGDRIADIHRNSVEYQALAFVAGGFADGTFHPASLESTEEETYVRFSRGEAVAMRNWPIWYRRLLITSTETDSGSGPEYAVEALPGALLGGQSLALSSGSPDREAALDLIGHLTGVRQQQLLFYCGGYAPTRQNVYTDKLSPEEAERLCAEYGITGEDAWHAEASGFLDTVRLAVDDAQLRPSSPYYPQFSEEVYTGLRPLFGDARRDAAPLDPGRLEEVRTAADNALRGR